MKIDSIETRFGEFVIEYTKFHHGLFISKYPEIFKTKSGFSIRCGRDSSFPDFDSIKKYIESIVNDFLQDYCFVRKVIAYKVREYRNSFEFQYMIANENMLERTMYNVPKKQLEYFVLETNVEGRLGKRDIFPQLIFGESDSWVMIDYDENIHNFIVDFDTNFNNLRSRIKEFFKKDDVYNNIMTTLESKQKLIS